MIITFVCTHTRDISTNYQTWGSIYFYLKISDWIVIYLIKSQWDKVNSKEWKTMTPWSPAQLFQEANPSILDLNYLNKILSFLRYIFHRKGRGWIQPLWSVWVHFFFTQLLIHIFRAQMQRDRLEIALSFSTYLLSFNILMWHYFLLARWHWLVVR